MTGTGPAITAHHAPGLSPLLSPLLLTGFEPFAGDGHNPSWPAAQEAARRLRDRGFDAVAVRLPCSFAGSTEALERALAEHRPGTVIACGLAGGRTRVAVERVAVNLQDARIPDNAGAQPAGQAVDEAGPAAYFSTLPVKRIFAALREAAIPAELSLSAGSFVCNHLFYALMARAETSSVRTAGFIHVPWDENAPRRTAGVSEHADDRARPEPWPTLPGTQLAEALVIAALEAARPASDLDEPDGSLY
ncbi:pyrrolidone-carboxylate peptidase [Citricoccus zhacaiensis]|uniref:Pyroglutamyl-peptidase I n=1 Tax=Citricoccus zhacaiensis TaxID=489142 RepID=A0ABQ2M0L3_9MICC|nr:pyroglutamyl-peptidase I [Citricoccus zhacaiensis]GGO44493.1 pyrrolidone-carboxylate peptidase [Citricoccus zhacaiensis]